MREVKVYAYPKNVPTGPALEKIMVGIGVFHEFGVDYENFNDTPAYFTAAIVEMSDGSVMCVPVENIQFVVPTAMLTEGSS